MLFHSEKLIKKQNNPIYQSADDLNDTDGRYENFYHHINGRQLRKNENSPLHNSPNAISLSNQQRPIKLSLEGKAIPGVISPCSKTTFAIDKDDMHIYEMLETSQRTICTQVPVLTSPHLSERKMKSATVNGPYSNTLDLD